MDSMFKDRYPKLKKELLENPKIKASNRKVITLVSNLAVNF